MAPSSIRSCSNLPANARCGPGPLGPGAFYYDAARAPNAYQLYFKALSLRVKECSPGLSFEVGRMGFQSGGEAASASPDLERLKRERLQGRLLGEVEWTPFERTFDGVRARRRTPRAGTRPPASSSPRRARTKNRPTPRSSGVRVAIASLSLWGTPVRAS